MSCYTAAYSVSDMIVVVVIGVIVIMIIVTIILTVFISIIKENNRKPFPPLLISQFRRFSQQPSLFLSQGPLFVFAQVATRT